MNRRRLIFFGIFGFYHLVVLLFTAYIDVQKSDLGVLTSMYKFIYLFKYGAILGLVLLGIDFVWTWREIKVKAKEHDTLQLEINSLKAKVYDFQEASKREVSNKEETGDDSGVASS